jgi:hypothetical protein
VSSFGVRQAHASSSASRRSATLERSKYAAASRRPNTGGAVMAPDNETQNTSEKASPPVPLCAVETSFRARRRSSPRRTWLRSRRGWRLKQPGALLLVVRAFLYDAITVALRAGLHARRSSCQRDEPHVFSLPSSLRNSHREGVGNRRLWGPPGSRTSTLSETLAARRPGRVNRGVLDEEAHRV